MLTAAAAAAVVVVLDVNEDELITYYLIMRSPIPHNTIP